jgi:DNA processing protein
MAGENRSSSDIESWLTLYRINGIGPSSFHKLLGAFRGNPAAALKANETQWQQAGLNGRQIKSLTEHKADPKADLRWLEAKDHHLVLFNDAAYPNLLAEIPNPPPILFVRGDQSILSHPQLAIVGSRNPTRAGLENAHAFAKHLAHAGLGITSGLAIGIDGASHEGALHATGMTIAVAATGLDQIYPARHRKLADNIADSGAIISEFPIGARPQAEHFPRRNRIISGLSIGTLVIEAAKRSGSLITARNAGEQGREIFAIPGSIHNPLARGCHQLIRQGAKLVETAEDILEELGPILASRPPNTEAVKEESISTRIDPEHKDLLQYIDYEPTPINVIISRSGLTAEAVSSMLLIMELNNHIASEAGGCYVRMKLDKDERERN